MASHWISVDCAKSHILSHIVPIKGKVETTLPFSLWRITASEIIAPFSVPGYNNSAMDGYACRLKDVETVSKRLKILGTAWAGHPFSNASIKTGECVKIMTGAKIPEGADIVIPQEETTVLEGNDVEINANTGRFARLHIRSTGEDLMVGKTALPLGQLLRPAEVGLLSSLGISSVSVKRALRVAFFSTGDEVKAVGDVLSEGEVYDSNRHTLRALIARMGFEGLDFGIVPDDPIKLASVINQAAEEADVIITSGGASVGEADYIRSVLETCGQMMFWKVAMRPGRPLTYGKIRDVDFFGLPGNPVSVMVCFYQFVREALWKRAGRVGSLTLPTLPAISQKKLKKNTGRTEFLRGQLFIDDQGQWCVTTTGDQGSGILSSMVLANCFIVLAEDQGSVAEGETVQVQLFEGIV